MSGRPRGRPLGRRSKPLERVTEVRRRRIRESDEKRQLRLQLYREAQRRRRQYAINQQLGQNSSQENIEANPPDQDSETPPIQETLSLPQSTQAELTCIQNLTQIKSEEKPYGLNVGEHTLLSDSLASDSTEQCQQNFEDMEQYESLIATEGIEQYEQHLDLQQYESQVSSEGNGKEHWLEEQSKEKINGIALDTNLPTYKREKMPFTLGPLEISNLRCDAFNFPEKRVSNANRNSFGGFSENQFNKNEKAKKNLYTQDYVPQYNFTKIKSVKHSAVSRAIKKKDENDFPTFKAKGVKKTYQAKSRVNEDELKPKLTEIKKEIDLEVFSECDATVEEQTFQSDVEDGTETVFPNEPLCQVFLPKYYFPEEESVIQREILVTRVIQENLENDFPVFEAEKVKKTYQVKRKVSPEQEPKPILTEIKKEVEVDIQVFPGCAATVEEQTLQSHVEDGTDFFLFYEEPQTEESIQEDIKSELEEYEDDIICLSKDSPTVKHPEPIKQEPEDHINVQAKQMLTQTSHTRIRPMNKQSRFKYPCSRCNRKFLTARKYILHFTTHGIAYMTCPVCQQSFQNMTTLIKHITNHVKQTYLKIVVITRSAPGKRKNARDEVKYQCKECKSKVEHDNLYSHWDTHFKTGWKSNELDDCVTNDMSLQSDQLKVVNEILVATKIDMIAKDCVICHRHFERKNDYKRHLIEHLLTDAYSNKPLYGALRCQICHVGYQKANHYKLHMCDHGSLPVYRCEICDRAFSDSINLIKHKKVHNSQGNNCGICSKKFEEKSSLLKHLEMHHTIKLMTYSRFSNRADVKVKCQLCGMKYSSLKEKSDHLWLVHKESKHKAICPICKKEFRRLIDMKSHLMEHSVLPARKASETDDIEEFLRDNPALELTEDEMNMVCE